MVITKIIRNCLYIYFLLSIFVNECFAQQTKSFEIIEFIKTSPLKDQESSGTCWSFATTSFIETEAIRLGSNLLCNSCLHWESGKIY